MRAGQPLPRVFHVLEIGHVGHRASRLQVGKDHGLVRTAQDVGRLGHEMDAAEHDELGVGRGCGELRELERIAAEIGELHHALALVVMPQDHDAPAEAALGVPGARADLVLGKRRVLGEGACAGGDGRDQRAHVWATSLRPKRRRTPLFDLALQRLALLEASVERVPVRDLALPEPPA